MKKHLCLAVIYTLLFTLCSCSHTRLIERDASDVVSKHTILYTEPPKRIPARYATDAPLLGNGYTGVAIAGTPEHQVFYAARNDFWRLKSALDESFPLVLGKLNIAMPELQNASYRLEQSMYNATTTATFNNGEQSVMYDAWLSAEDDILVIEMKMVGKGSIEGDVTLSLPDEKDIFIELPLERDFPYQTEIGKTEKGISYLYRACEEAVDIKTKAAMAIKVSNSVDNKFQLTEGESVRIICAFSSNFRSNDCVKSAIDKVNKLTADDIVRKRQKHQQWWSRYWNQSFVSIPNQTIEKQYYVSLYGMACASRDPQFPPSIFGTWITGERPFWNGDYHLNYNHQAPYYALYSANRIEQATPYYAPLLDQIERGNYYSEQITNIKDGILLPVGIGPLGIETTRRTPFMEEYFGDWIASKNIEDEGMFWGQKSNAAYGAINLSMQFYRTWDVEFTKKVYPYMRGVANFWVGYLQKENDKYVIYNDAVHEGTIGTKNPIAGTALVKTLMRTITDMSVLLDVDESMRAQWLDIYQNMTPYSTQIRDGNEVFRYSEEGTDWWINNTLGIQHIYPAGDIGLNSVTKELEVARNTIAMMGRWLDSNGSNSFFPAAVRVGYDTDTILSKLELYSQNTYPNGFQKGNPHGIENYSTVPNTINEMLCMGHQGVVRVFPVWKQSEDAYFEKIRVEGAFLISSQLVDGEVAYIKVLSEKAKPIKIVNPWKGEQTILLNGREIQPQGEYILFDTQEGKRYMLSPKIQSVE